MRSLLETLRCLFKMEDSKISTSVAKLDLKNSKVLLNIQDLPNELLVQIFSKLAQDDILKKVPLVCKRFLEVSRLPKVLPMIKILCQGVFEEDLPMIQNCLAVYSKSQLHLDGLDITLSLGHFEVLESVAPSIQKLKIMVNFDLDFPEPPLFENLKELVLQDYSYEEDDFDFHGIGFWKQFPNLTSLKISLTSHYTNNTDVS